MAGCGRYFDNWVGDDADGPDAVGRLHIVTEFADGGTLADFVATRDYDEEVGAAHNS